MILKNILEEMLGREDGEFERLSVPLDLDLATRLRDLASQLGVPTCRLLAELVESSLPEAESEWRALMADRTVPDANNGPGLKFSMLPDSARNW